VSQHVNTYRSVSTKDSFVPQKHLINLEVLVVRTGKVEFITNRQRPVMLASIQQYTGQALMKRLIKFKALILLSMRIPEWTNVKIFSCITLFEPCLRLLSHGGHSRLEQINLG
jgi:hypothetical protein